MEEKQRYSPHDIVSMFEKISELEAALEEGNNIKIRQKIDEYRQAVPENVRNVLELSSGDKYIETRAMKAAVK